MHINNIHVYIYIYIYLYTRNYASIIVHNKLIDYNPPILVEHVFLIGFMGLMGVIRRETNTCKDRRNTIYIDGRGQ